MLVKRCADFALDGEHIVENGCIFIFIFTNAHEVWVKMGIFPESEVSAKVEYIALDWFLNLTTYTQFENFLVITHKHEFRDFRVSQYLISLDVGTPWKRESADKTGIFK